MENNENQTGTPSKECGRGSARERESLNIRWAARGHGVRN